MYPVIVCCHNIDLVRHMIRSIVMSDLVRLWIFYHLLLEFLFSRSSE